MYEIERELLEIYNHARLRRIALLREQLAHRVEDARNADDHKKVMETVKEIAQLERGNLMQSMV